MFAETNNMRPGFVMQRMAQFGDGLAIFGSEFAKGLQRVQCLWMGKFMIHVFIALMTISA